METLGHKTDQPGLRGHSHDPENDLMKKYVVALGMTTKGWWLWVASFDNLVDAGVYIGRNQPVDSDKEYKILDQFTDNETVWEG